MLSINKICKLINAGLDWEQETETVTITLPEGKVIQIQLGKDYVSENPVQIESITRFSETEIFISGSFIAEEFREYIEWNLEPDEAK